MPMTENQEYGVIILTLAVIWLVASMIFVISVLPVGGHWECIEEEFDVWHVVEDARVTSGSSEVDVEKIKCIEYGSDFGVCKVWAYKVTETRCTKHAWIKGGDT